MAERRQLKHWMVALLAGVAGLPGPGCSRDSTPASGGDDGGSLEDDAGSATYDAGGRAATDGGGLIRSDGGPEQTCSPAVDRHCSDGGVVLCSAAGAWPEQADFACPAPSVCLEVTPERANCVVACQAGTLTCSGAWLLKCGDDGRGWAPVAGCPGGCSEGRCIQQDCVPGVSCYDGPAGTEGRGICRVGLRECAPGGSVCTGQVQPGLEECNGQDDDCDGLTDEDLVRLCYEGAPETAGRGICRPGTQGCTGGTWTSCDGQQLPGEERCDGQDNDCNGETDERTDLQNDPDSCGRCGRSCAIPGTLTRCSRGECETFGCMPDHLDANGLPADGCECEPVTDQESRCDGRDDDCDGEVDENDGVACGVQPGSYHLTHLRLTFGNTRAAGWGGRVSGQQAGAMSNGQYRLRTRGVQP